MSYSSNRIGESWGRSRRVGILAVLSLPLALALGVSSGRRAHRGNDHLVAAQRMDLPLTVQASGVVASTVRTVIRCKVENVRGKKAATTILTILPEGSVVRRGDVICCLDASAHEELRTNQSLVVSQARADHRRAELDLESARVGLEEYRGGRSQLERLLLQGQIETARTQVTALSDRLGWSRRMLSRGYVSRAQIAAESGSLERSRADQARAEREYSTYERYTMPRALKQLESQVEMARANLEFQTARLRREEERLAALGNQVEQCTIRAPHDGLLIYAHKPKRGVRIEEGMTVRQEQELFYLPDPSRLEVQVLLHETVVVKVQPGMRARVWIEGLGESMEGTLSVIDPLPLADRSVWSSGEVKNYMGRIPLELKGRTIGPGATVEVEIARDVLRDRLVVPVESVRREDGQDVCYVRAPDGLERRRVSVGEADASWQEVIEGLAEGEQVAVPR